MNIIWQQPILHRPKTYNRRQTARRSILILHVLNIYTLFMDDNSMLDASLCRVASNISVKPVHIPVLIYIACGSGHVTHGHVTHEYDPSFYLNTNNHVLCDVLWYLINRDTDDK